MRRIGIISEEKQARSLADYLLTLQIQTEIKTDNEGWTIWVQNEDQVAQARKEIADFLQEPNHPRYLQAASIAREQKAREERSEEEYRQRVNRFNQKLKTNQACPITGLLIGFSILVGLVTNLGQQGSQPFTITGPVSSSDPTLYYTLLGQLTTGEIYRLVTPIFVHYSLFHLLFNMIWLAQMGGKIEQAFGSFKFLILVLLVAIVSNLGQYYLGQISFSESGQFQLGTPSPFFGGMSGVVYGLLGFILVKLVFQPELGIGIGINNTILLLVWLVICMMGITGANVANAAHLVGLLVGALIGTCPCRD